MDEDVPIVDAHHHLWDLDSTLRYPWLESGEHAWLGQQRRPRVRRFHGVGGEGGDQLQDALTGAPSRKPVNTTL